MRDNAIHDEDKLLDACDDLICTVHSQAFGWAAAGPIMSHPAFGWLCGTLDTLW